MAQACEGKLRAPVHSQAAAGDVEWGRERGALLCVYVTFNEREKVRRKGGHRICPEELPKTFQFKRNILQAKAPGESVLSICRVTGHTPPLLGKAAHSPLQSTAVSEHSPNRSQAKCISKHKEPEAICAAASRHILHCHHAKWKRLKRKKGRWHFTIRYLQKTLSDWKRWYGFSQWLDLGINNVVLLQPHIIPLLGCQSQSAVFELRDDGQVSRERRVQVLPWSAIWLSTYAKQMLKCILQDKDLNVVVARVPQLSWVLNLDINIEACGWELNWILWL